MQTQAERDLQQQVFSLQTQLEAANAQVEYLKTQPLSEYSAALIEIVNDLLAVVGFAIANLPPAATAGWPAEKLDRAMRMLKVVTAVEKRYLDIVDDWIIFAAEARASEAIRAEKKAKAPRSKPPTKKQLDKMKTDFEKEFGVGILEQRMRAIASGK